MKIDAIMCTPKTVTVFRGKSYIKNYHFTRSSYKRLSETLFHKTDEFKFNFAPLLMTPGWIAVLRDDLRVDETK